MTWIATGVYVLGIVGLFWLDRKSASSRISFALWLPVTWLCIAGSRSLSSWFFPDPSNSDNNPLDRLISAFLMLFAIVVLARRGRRLRIVLRSNVPVIVFFIYCILSVFWSDYPVATITRWWKAFGDLLMIFVILSDPMPVDAVCRVLARVSFILLPLSILFNKYYPEISRYYDRWTGRPFFAGVSVDKNMLGVTCLAFALSSTWSLITAVCNRRQQKPGSLLAYGVVVYTALSLLARIDSMTSLSCFLLGAVIIVAMQVQIVSRAAFVRHSLIVGATGVVVMVLFFEFGGTVLVLMGRDPTLTGRTDLWAVLSPLNPRPLVGAGFEAFWRGQKIEDLKLLDIFANEAHNGYFEVYLNLGWIGVAFLALMLINGYRTISRAIRLNSAVGALWLAYFVSGLVYSLTEAGFRVNSPIWITTLIAIMGASLPDEGADKLGTVTKLLNSRKVELPNARRNLVGVGRRRAAGYRRPEPAKICSVLAKSSRHISPAGCQVNMPMWDTPRRHGL